MKRRFLLILLIIICLNLFAGCAYQEGSNELYTFTNMEDDSKLTGSSKITNILDIYADVNEKTIIQGRLLALFGEPLYESMNLENQYSYVIEAADQNGNAFYLNAYHGASGPAIGGDRSIDGIEDAAKALITYIQNAEPVDFDYFGYYPDGPYKIHIGIKNGEPYYSNETITDEDEIKKMFDSIY